MKVLIAGSAGFIGFSLAKRLVDLGNQVIGIDNLSGLDQNYVKLKRHEIISKESKFKFFNISKEDSSLYDMLKDEKIDYCVDLATRNSYYGTYKNKELFQYSPFIETNVLGTARLYETSV